MASIEKLNWDSKFFGYPIGKIDIQSFDELNVPEFKKESLDYKLVYIFSKESFENNGFHLVDKKVIYYQDNISSIKFNYQNTNIQSFDKRKHDIDQLTKLALESGAYSRFKIDSNFRHNEYEKLYKEWIIKCVNKVLAFEILVSINNDEILGFITLSEKTEKTADIGLVAVHKNARGMGIGTDLIRKTIQKAASRNFTTIQVVTQADNRPAVSLYTKNNFLLKEKTNIYHYWNL